MSTGTQLAYSAGEGGLVPGLLEGTTYYVIKVDNDRIRLAATRSEAMAGTAIDISEVPYLQSRETIAQANGVTGELTTSAAHGFHDGEFLTYTRLNGGNDIGLTDNGRYLVLKTGASAIKLFSSNSRVDVASSAISVSGKTISTNAPFSNGTPVAYVTEGSAIGGLTSQSIYYVIESTSNSFKLAATPGGSPIGLTTSGSGKHIFYPLAVPVGAPDAGKHLLGGQILNIVAAEDLYENIVGNTVWDSGDPVVFNNPSEAPIPGLTDGATYRVVISPGDNGRIWLAPAAKTVAEAKATAESALTKYDYDIGLADIASVDSANEVITLTKAHNLQTGDRVQFTRVSGSDSIGGLSLGSTVNNTLVPNNYFVIRISSTQIKLAKTEDDANADTAIPINLTSGAGSSLFRLLRNTQDGTSLASTRAAAYDSAFASINNGQVIAFSLAPSLAYTGSDSSSQNREFIPVPEEQGVILEGTFETLKLTENIALTYKAAYGSGLTDLAHNDIVYAVADPAGRQQYAITALSGGEFTTNIPFPFNTGDPVVFESGNSGITGATSGSTYYIVKTGARTFKIAETLAKAEASPAEVVTASGGVGTTASIRWGRTRLWLLRTQANAVIASEAASTALTGALSEVSANPSGFDGNYLKKMTREAATGSSTSAMVTGITAGTGVLSFTAAIPFATGDKVTYLNSNMASDTGAIPGLVLGGAYFVIRDSSTSMRLATTREAAFLGQPILFGSLPANSQGHEFIAGSTGQGSITGFDMATNSVITSGGHGFVTGDSVSINLISGVVVPGGLQKSTPYKAVIDSPNRIAFVTELSDIRSVNVADSTIGVPSGINVGAFDALTYNRSGGGSDIEGLTSGTPYLAIPRRGESGTTSLWLANSSPVTVASATSTVFSSTAHGLADGDRVVYRGTASGTGDIADLGIGRVYFVVGKTDNGFSLANTANGSVITTAGTSVGGQRFHKIVSLGSFTASDSSRHTLATPRITISDPSKTISNGSASTDLLTFSSAHGLNTFDSILLAKTGSGNDPAGLVTDKTYLVIKEDSTRLRLADAAASIKSQGVVPDGDTIRFSDNDTIPSNGMAIVYRRTDNGEAGQADIGGLASGTTYYTASVDSVNRTFKLSATRNGAVINLTSAGVGNHLFVPIADITADFDSSGSTTFQLSSRIEVKSQQRTGSSIVAEVNTAAEQLAFPSSHGLSTGQRVYYQAVSGRPIEGLVSGQFYFVIRDSDTTVRLAKAKSDALATSPVAVNLRSGGQTGSHRLVSISDPFVGIELGPTRMTGLEHTVTASPGGIVIRSESVGSTRSINSENIGKIIGDAIAKSPLAMAANAAGSRALGAIKGLLGLGSSNSSSSAATEKFTSKTGQQKSNVTGSLGIQIANIHVDTIVRQSAVLESLGDLSITTMVRNRDLMTTRAIASVSDDPSQAGAKTTVTVAMSVGVYSYSSRVLVEQGATLDASGLTRIEAKTKSPFMIPGPGASEEEKSEFEDDNKRDTGGDDLFGFMMNTALAKTGLGYLQLNNWTQASGAPAGELAISGSIQVQTYN
ncbi:MAG: hypothetical protein ACKO26_03005, partial [Planctomycetota bacterium]